MLTDDARVGVLPYISYMGVCHCKGMIFKRFSLPWDRVCKLDWFSLVHLNLFKTQSWIKVSFVELGIELVRLKLCLQALEEIAVYSAKLYIISKLL